MTKLWHVSETKDIGRFHPRMPSNADAAVTEAVVWAVDDAHLANYLLPRDCPRICLRTDDQTSEDDRQTFFRSSSAPVLILIEELWYDRALQTPLWLYELPSASFKLIDSNAGYYVSSEAVDPVAVTETKRPLEQMQAHGVELRCVPHLRSIAARVARSTLAFSIIRLRNAAVDAS